MSSIHRFPNQKYPALSPQGFLERAFMWINSETDIGLFYAALELRKCFESVWLKHGMASDDYSDEFTALNWRPDRIASSLNVDFILELDFEKSYRFTLDPSNPHLTMGYFLSMPQELFEAKDRVNEFIHAQWAIPIAAPGREWYRGSHEFLLGFANSLIPHASSDNSLIRVCTPQIQVVEIAPEQLRPVLIKTLSEIDRLKLT